MAKLGMFNFTTLNGFYKGPNGDINWHRHGGEEEDYSKKGVGAGGVLLFGRVTYEMMASFWPTPTAAQAMPEVAAGMNKAEKIVFSRKLKKADWNNTTVVNGDLVDAIKKLKKTSKKDLTILGSGSIVTQCAEAGLIDTYQFMIDPVALGDGTPSFKGLKQKLDLKLTGSQIFKSGVVLLSYEPMK